MTEQDQPYFDDTRKALAFALNFQGEVKAPTMSRILAQVQSIPKKVSKAARKRYLAQFDKDFQPELYAFVEELLTGSAFKGSRRTPWSPPSPKGLDGAHLSGYILAHFARLEDHQQAILKARTITAYSRCACGSPCCSGWRKHPEWARAIVLTCELLQHAGEVVREAAGKRGLSSRPEMRLAIVEQYFTHNTLTLTEIARIGSVTLVTAGKHKEWITTYLEQEEDSAWTDLSRIFDQAGITGAFV